MDQTEQNMLEQDAEETVEKNQGKGFKEAISEAVLLTKEIAKRTDELKRLNDRLTYLRQKTLPDFMTLSGQDSFSHGDFKFELAKWISGSWPKTEKKAREAATYLEEERSDDIIQTRVVVSLQKGELDIAQMICQSINHLCEPEIITSVHPQTLHAFARKRLKSNKPINLGVLGLNSGLIVKIKPPKKK